VDEIENMHKFLRNISV